VTELTIVIGKTVDDKYYFRVRTKDGRLLLTSRDYQHIEKCMNEVYGIQHYRDFAVAEEFCRDNGHQYTITGKRERMVGNSPFYIYQYDMKRDIELLKKSIGKAEVIDTSALVRFFRPVRIK
jgi:uncharacterized protein YegP (UPF0339 family)